MIFGRRRESGRSRNSSDMWRRNSISTLCGPVRGEQKAADIERTKTTKAETPIALSDSFAYCDAAYNQITDASAQQIVNTGGNRG